MEILISEEIDKAIKEKSEMIREKYSNKYFWELKIKFLRLNNVINHVEYIYTYPYRQMDFLIKGENLYNIVRLLLDYISKKEFVVFDCFQIYFSCRDIIDPDYNSGEIFICEIPVKNKNIPYGIFD